MWEHLYRVALRYLRDRGVPLQDAEDIAQEALISTYLHTDGIQEGRLVAYVLAAARNRHVDLIRKRRHEAHELDLRGLTLDRPLCAAGVEAARTEAEQVETREAVEGALRRLNPTERRLFHMRYRLDLTTFEIATRLNTSPDTVKTLLWRLRKKMSAHLKEGEGR